MLPLIVPAFPNEDNEWIKFKSLKRTGQLEVAHFKQRIASPMKGVRKQKQFLISENVHVVKSPHLDARTTTITRLQNAFWIVGVTENF